MSSSIAKRTLVIILRVLSIITLFALVFVFAPFSWMNEIHRSLGLGELPNTPVVQYMARSLSAMYAFFAVLLLWVSFRIDSHLDFLQIGSLSGMVLGGILLFVDISAGLPMDWILGEGPLIIVVFGLILFLVRKLKKFIRDT